MQERRLVREGIGYRFRYSWDATSRAFTYHGEEPDEEDLRSFMLIFRQFVSEGEPVHLRRVLNDCDRYLASEQLKEELRQARAAWDQVFRRPGNPRISVNGKDLTTEYVLDLWINGHYFHNDQAKARALNAIDAGVFPVSRMLMIRALPQLTAVVLFVADIVVRALCNGQFSFPAAS